MSLVDITAWRSSHARVHALVDPLQSRTVRFQRRAMVLVLRPLTLPSFAVSRARGTLALVAVHT